MAYKSQFLRKYVLPGLLNRFAVVICFSFTFYPCLLCFIWAGFMLLPTILSFILHAHCTSPLLRFQYPHLAKDIIFCNNKKCTKVKILHCFSKYFFNTISIFPWHTSFSVISSFHNKFYIRCGERLENQEYFQRTSGSEIQYQEHFAYAFYSGKLFHHTFLRYNSCCSIRKQNQSGYNLKHR